MAGGIDARIAVDPDHLRREQDRVTRAVLRAGKDTIQKITRRLEQDLEAMTREAVPGNLWRAWKSEVFPRGAGIAREPTGTIFVNGGPRSAGAIRFFTRPGRIRGKEGGFLAIPTAAAGSQGKNRHLTPAEWERRTGAKLRFVYRRNRPSLLVLDAGVLSGKGQIAKLNTPKRQASGRGNATIVIFVLMPMVSFANRFSVDPVVRRWAGRIDSDLKAALKGMK
jgi:hypothetical protein